jgi:regulatory protein
MSGRITSVVVQHRNPNRVNIHLDGEFMFGLHKLTAAWLTIGQELTDEQIENLKTKDLAEVIHQSALRLLNYRQRTAVEMMKRLILKGYDREQVKAVVDRLQENHLLDDTQFAESWVNDRITLHPRSKRLMAYEMMNKGLDGQVVQIALAKAGDDTQLADAAARKAMHKWENLAVLEFITHCAAFLGRKGFAAGICFSTARNLWKELQREMEQ